MALDYEDDELDRRKTKKRRRKRYHSDGSSGMMWMLILGGVVVLMFIVVGTYFMVRKDLPKEEPVAQKPEKKKDGAKVDPDPEKKNQLGTVARTDQMLKLEIYMSQLGTAYLAYEIENNGRGPSRAEDLFDYLGKVQKYIEPLKDGTVTFIYGFRRGQLEAAGAANTIIAYETVADAQGVRVVLMGDGRTTRRLNEADFKAAPKAGGK